MACNVFDGFQAMSEHLNPEIYRKVRLQDYWLELVERTTFPENTGYEQTVTTIDNVEPPTTIPTWNAINPVSDSNVAGPCATDFVDVQWGYNKRVYEPEGYDLQGPVLCKDEFTFDWMTDEFIRHYIDQLAMVTRRVWSNRYQEHFMSLTPKYIANGSNTFYPGSTLAPGVNEASIPAVQATSELTQDMLDDIFYRQLHIGATQQGPTDNGYITMGPDGPIFPLLISVEMSKRISFQSDRKDAYLWAGAGQMEASELMKNIGATKVLYNYRHIPCMYPARYNWNGAGYTRVEPFLQVAATGKGIDAQINPAWEAAGYEAAQILHPLVMRSEVVQPEVNAGGLPFDPANYYGDWQFITGGNRIFPAATACFDPLFKFGRHFAQFKHAIRPIFPDYGVTIIYKRCLNAPFTVSCS